MSCKKNAAHAIGRAALDYAIEGLRSTIAFNSRLVCVCSSPLEAASAAAAKSMIPSPIF
jgi:hypothetical protein